MFLHCKGAHISLLLACNIGQMIFKKPQNALHELFIVILETLYANSESVEKVNRYVIQTFKNRFQTFKNRYLILRTPR